MNSQNEHKHITTYQNPYSLLIHPFHQAHAEVKSVNNYKQKSTKAALYSKI